MAVRSLLFLTILLVVVVVVVVSVLPPVADAQLLGNLLGLIHINGVVYCTANSTGITDSTPVFPNASVQLMCGNTIVSAATTTNSGVFSVLLDPVTTLLSSLLNNCRLVVGTPLSTCNASLPSTGSLQSALSFVGSIVQGLLSITNVVPSGFNLLQ